MQTCLQPGRSCVETSERLNMKGIYEARVGLQLRPILGLRDMQALHQKVQWCKETCRDVVFGTCMCYVSRNLEMNFSHVCLGHTHQTKGQQCGQTGANFLSEFQEHRMPPAPTTTHRRSCNNEKRPTSSKETACPCKPQVLQ